MNNESAINGIVLVDKPAGMTSFDVIRILRKRLQIKSIGHAGTLDPFATGLLVVAAGQATRALSHLLLRRKAYLVRVVFGATSETLDTEGEVRRSAAGPQLTAEVVASALTGFIGTYPQLPPDYSAKKIRGKRACDRVRRGEIIELHPVSVCCDSAALLGFGIESAPPCAGLPFADIRLEVGSGFYVRSFARDLGEALRVFALASRLCREQVGGFSVARAKPPGEIERGDLQPLTPDDFDMPVIVLDDASASEHFRHGRAFAVGSIADGPVTVFALGKWAGFGEVKAGQLHPRKVIAGVFTQ